MRSALTDRDLEQQLVARSKAGDRRALEELLSSHYEKMLAVALKYTRSPDNAQDAVQDACIQCIRHIEKFREESSFRTWATRITVNCALMHRRKNKRLIPVGTVVEDKHAQQDRNPESDVVVAQQLREVESKLRSGRSGDYELFVQRYVRGSAISDIGNETGMTVAAIKTRIHRARYKLRSSLLKEWSGETDRRTSPNAQGSQLGY